MKINFRRFLLIPLLLGAGAPTSQAAGRYLEVTYPPGEKKDEMQLGVTYTLWLPDATAAK